jgi:hypothetical protein
MPNKLAIDDFEPKHLKEANEKLNKHVLCADAHKKTNDGYKKNIFKETLWNKFIGIFKK